jgi:hypothetical protein
LQTFGVLKRQWRIMSTQTEEYKPQKCQSVWCCLILHNMMLRYRAALAGVASGMALEDLLGMEADFAGDVAVVDAELGPVHVPRLAPAASAAVVDDAGSSDGGDEAEIEAEAIVEQDDAGADPSMGHRMKRRRRGGQPSAAAQYAAAKERREMLSVKLWEARLAAAASTRGTVV